jgi:hypothetical protein
VREETEKAGRQGGRSGGRARSGLRRSPDLAAILAVLIPGAGHLYLGRFRAAAGWLAAILLGYWVVFFPGVVLHAISIWSAYRTADDLRSDGR